MPTATTRAANRINSALFVFGLIVWLLSREDVECSRRGNGCLRRGGRAADAARRIGARVPGAAVRELDLDRARRRRAERERDRIDVRGGRSVEVVGDRARGVATDRVRPLTEGGV